MWRKDNGVEDDSSRLSCCLNGIAIALGVCIVISLIGVINMQVQYKNEQSRQVAAYREDLKIKVSSVKSELKKWEGYHIKLASGTELVLPSSYSFEPTGGDTYELADESVLRLSDYKGKDNLSNKREDLLRIRGKQADITSIHNLNSYVRYIVDYSAGVVGKRTCYFVYEDSVYGELEFKNNTVAGTSIDQFLSQLALGFRGDYTEIIDSNIEELTSRLSYVEGKMRVLENEE